MQLRIVFIILFSVFLYSCNSSKNEDNTDNTSSVSENEYITDPNQKRIALVIGNADYNKDKLDNPVNDAKDIAKALRNLNFDVIEATDLDEEEFYSKIDEFGRKLEKNCVALFYYAGHGMQVNGQNYLLPTDAEISSIHKVDNECIATDEILVKLEKAQTMLNIIILDACRNNPFRSWTRAIGERGLATMNAPNGTIIAYSTAAGKEALDGNGRNSPFTTALKKYIKKPNITFMKVLQLTSAEVTGQTPWRSSSYNEDFYMLKTKNVKNEVNENNTIKLEETKKDSLIKEDAASIYKTKKDNPIISEYPKTENGVTWIDEKHGTFIDKRDNHKYKVVKIGEQVWMAENLNYTKGITNITDGGKWAKQEHNNTAAWCYYNNKAKNGEIYGALYNFAAALKVAPKGWHLPTVAEIKILLNNYGGRSKKAYFALKKEGKSDFNILFGGWRFYGGDFISKDENARFFTANKYGTMIYGWNCDLNDGFNSSLFNYAERNDGLNIRLLKN